MYRSAKQGGMDRKPPAVPHAGRYDSSLIFKPVLIAAFFLAIVFKIKFAGILEEKKPVFFLF